ncbi:4-hydroxy-tetrahydrodipicolinate reductase [Candidatus Auribacterota bacterium]
MIKIVVCGAAGRMGKRIIACAAEDDQCKVVGAVDSADHPDKGRDSGEISGTGKNGVVITDDLSSVIDGADVVIDFSHHSVTSKVAGICAKSKKPLVVGTTAITADELKEINKFSKDIPLIVAPNMSVGANMVFSKAGEIAKILGDDYDIEIVEAHHRMKKDAPSGTANRIADVIAKAVNADMDKDGVYGRKGNQALRKKGEIGVHAVRAGDIVGDHTVIYCGNGERIELVHRAHSRDTFAKGAIRAAKYVLNAKPGSYDMFDVLDLK